MTALIELLVVIAIIGILSSVVLASLNTARGKARDAKRQRDMGSMHTALELFYSSNGRYPSATDGVCTYTQSFLAGGCLQVLVTNGHISVLPTDPTASQQYYYDNWCNVPLGTSVQKFRMWATTEFNQNGLAQNWWTDTTVGRSTCQDPS